ncbi:MAG TPA: hypothetical protein DEB47_17765 [Citreicella sp.]|nr:hypothetical protein [Citreicella sp.]
MADLNTLGVVTAAERGAEMILKHPATGADLDITFDVLGFDAEAVVQAGREFDRAEAKRTPEDRARDGESAMSRRNVALAVAAVTGWRNVQRGDADVPFSKEAASEILSNPNFVWMIGQIVAFGGKRQNFFPASSGD